MLVLPSAVASSGARVHSEVTAPVLSVCTRLETEDSERTRTPRDEEREMNVPLILLPPSRCHSNGNRINHTFWA